MSLLHLCTCCCLQYSLHVSVRKPLSADIWRPCMLRQPAGRPYQQHHFAMAMQASSGILAGLCLVITAAPGTWESAQT